MLNTMFSVIFLLLTLTDSNENNNVALTTFHTLDAYIAKNLSKFDIPTLSISIVDNEKVIFSKNYGNFSKQKPSFYIGSVSKAITSFAIHRILEEKQLSLDTAVAKYITEIDLDEKITIEHLLTHTSGITKLDGFRNIGAELNNKEEPTAIKLESRPGQNFQYSNLNYVLLGMVAEKLSGLKFDELLAAYVFDPLSMSQSSGKCKDHKTLGDHYQYWSIFTVESEPEYDDSSIPAGFICSSTHDLANFLITMLNEGTYQGVQLLKSETVKKMHSPLNNQKNRVCKRLEKRCF